MDIARLLPGELTSVVNQLDRCADRLEVCALQAAAATTATVTTWQGPAASLHRERVRGHVDDLNVLAAGVRRAARRVEDLQAAAERRLLEVGSIDLRVGLGR